jgi:hypothetical protein
MRGNGRAQPFQCSHPKLSIDSARHSFDFPPDFVLLIGAKMEPSKVLQICLPRFASISTRIVAWLATARFPTLGSRESILRRRRLGSGYPSGSRFRGGSRWYEVWVGSGVLKVLGAFWDKLEGESSISLGRPEMRYSDFPRLSCTRSVGLRPERTGWYQEGINS